MSKRPRLSRHRHVPTLGELADADGVDVGELLREVSEFRLALDTDLTIAAAAADAAADLIAPVELSSELTDQALDAGRSALDELVTRRLEVAAVEPAPARARRSGSRRRRVLHSSAGQAGGVGPAAGRPAGRRIRGVPLIGVGPLVGVAIVLSLGTGFFASELHHSTAQSQGLADAADNSLHSLSSALGEGDDQAAREAGNQLSAAIGSLIAAAPGNPAAAQLAASALTAEKSLLATATGQLGEQLRASMTAQVVALQSTVHTPIETLLATTTPSSRATPVLRLPLTLPSRLTTLVPSIVAVPSLPARPTPSRRPTASHSPDPVSSLVGVLVPPTASIPAQPATTAPGVAASSASPTPTSSPASPSSSPSGSPSPSASEGPLPISTSVSGGNYIPH